jgi:hypothetical protein
MTQSQERTAYIIEQADPANPHCVLAGKYFGIAGSMSAGNPGGSLQWLDRVDNALQFSTREGAQLFVNYFLGLSERLPHENTLRGFRSGDYFPIIVEHGWS